VVNKIHTSQLSHDTVLNINVPDVVYEDIQGFQTTRLGKRHISEKSIPDESDPLAYWIGENGKEADNGVGTDFHAIANNYVSVTPLQIDLTKYNEIDTVANWLKGLN
jgi:5'-nucleotidase